ncbi:MAG: hypothetical protein M3R08_09280 [Bacteroidota bacterium]|nr:hypothetical protein [Bacteroidota bacterium]
MEEFEVRELHVNIVEHNDDLESSALQELEDYMEELRELEQEIHELEMEKQLLLERMIESCVDLGNQAGSYAPPAEEE